MNVRSFLLTAAIIGGFIGSVYAAPIAPVGPPAGIFGLPYNENQTGPNCSTPGWKLDQYHMQWNTDFSKYHMGEDWNGLCGGSTDENYPLLAIADGKVVYIDDVDDTSKGKQLYIRYSFPYAPGPSDVQTFDSAYLHINGVATGVTWSGSGTGSNVVMGQEVAYVGGTGGWTPHLHWEVQWDDTISLSENSYQNPLTKSHALKYRAASLIVDDRKQSLGYTVLGDGQWYSFTMQGNAPSSTMYIKYNGERKSLKNAIAAGWIPSMGILYESGGSWYYYSDVDDNFFEDGKQYAISSLISGVEHLIPVPQNSFQRDRARLDMIHAVENDSRFADALIETYGYDPNWDPSWELHWMAFRLSDGRTAYVNQITYKTNRLVRNTNYYDPDLVQWTGWKWFDWNQLY